MSETASAEPRTISSERKPMLLACALVYGPVLLFRYNWSASALNVAFVVSSSGRGYVFVRAQFKYATGWSWRLEPTAGKSRRTSTPAASRTDAGPMPESWRICGVWIEPAARMTSFLAVNSTISFVARFNARTPVTVVVSLSKVSVLTWCWVSMTRLVLSETGS